MTVKKTTTTRKGSAKAAPARRTMKQRAERVINSNDYSDDTRAAVKSALDTNADDLAELVRRAESGEEIANITNADTEADDLRARAEAIINSTEQSASNRGLVRLALEENLPNLAAFVGHAERGEILDAMKNAPPIKRDPLDAETAAMIEDRQARFAEQQRQPRTFTYADSSRMYESEHYAGLYDGIYPTEQLKGMITEAMHGSDSHDQTVALLTLIHAAASFEKQDDRRQFCIAVATACMDDVADVWGALGAALIRRAAATETAGTE